VLPPSLAELADALREIDVYPAVVDQDILHLGIGGLARGLLLVLDESVLKTVARLPVANDLTAQDLAEAAEDEFQILVGGDRVQLAHKEDVFRSLDLGEGKIPHQLERQRIGPRGLIPPAFLGLL